MLTDIQGNALTGATAEAVSAYDAAVRAFNIYRGDPVALADAAIAAAPEMTMAHILKAWLFALATEPAAAAEARVIVTHAASLPANERERSHIAALRHVLACDWTDAAVALDRHNMHYPHDLLALQAGHLVDFLRGNARNLRDRIARVLPKWDEARPGHSILLGMYAFGLEEAGDYARAEAVGREATERQPLDCWAHHAVAHVLEMQGRAADGVAWMDARQPHWDGDDNFFKVHNWWHKALFHLETEDAPAALTLYDSRVRDTKSGIALELVDASALLWRLACAGVDVGDRWGEVATAWDAHADGELYPFNDWHAAMAWLGAGRDYDVAALVARYRAGTGKATESARWARATALPLIEGFAAFWHGDHGKAVEVLHPARAIANGFGGSHAQRDVIDWTLTEAALRGGFAGTAEALASERLALKPHSPINRAFLERARGQGTGGATLAA